ISCLSNCKQIGNGLSMYVQDYDETFPLVIACNAPSGAGTTPQLLLDPYIKSNDVWVCPSASTQEILYYDAAKDLMSDSVPSRWYYPKGFKKRPTIGTNDNIIVNIGCNLTGSVRRLASVAAPANTVAAADSRLQSTCGGRRVIWANTCVQPCGNISGMRASNIRHQGGENLIFCDGHAKWMAAPQIADHCRDLFDPSGADHRTYWEAVGVAQPANAFN
ncbi:MAG: hypothetical protein IT210_10660, partial [Armatimonadetes bacterium]|nr:hypothetical protein [Armatimonadota bacterium]